MNSNDLDSKKPLLPDELLFPVENISGSLEDYPNLKNCLKLSSESTDLSQQDRNSLHKELRRMKEELLSKQQLYQEQFDKLKGWMRDAFEVENPQILLDHQAKIKENELAVEDAENQGNSKQHQRIRTLNK